METNGSSAAESIKDDVKEYYGKVLTSSKDLKTNVCTAGMMKMPRHVRQAIGMVHEDVTSRFYGCGLVAPESLEGMRILDLGSGSGQDCYVLSQLVGEQGHVTGIDMTEAQLEVAKKYIDYHRDKFGYSQANVDFVMGYIERLEEAGLKDNSFDLIVSNCVVNLSPDKKAVIKEAYRVLKDGGEMYFSDVYADCDLPDEVRKHKVLWGECVSGALWWEDLVSLARDVGFAQPCLVKSNMFEFGNKALEEAVGDAKFVSATYRLFKLPNDLSPACLATYDGKIIGYGDKIVLDHKTIFKAGEAKVVNAEVATILKSSRFQRNFKFEPTQETAPKLDREDLDPFKLAAASKPSSGGCCGPKAKKASCGSQEDQPTEGCCGQKEVVEEGCCEPKKKKSEEDCC